MANKADPNGIDIGKVQETMEPGPITLSAGNVPVRHIVDQLSAESNSAPIHIPAAIARFPKIISNHLYRLSIAPLRTIRVPTDFPYVDRNIPTDFV